MTSAKVMLSRALAAALLFVLLGSATGCDTVAGLWGGDERLRSPYAERQVWAVAPLANESGTLHMDGARVADHLTQQIETVEGLDAVAVNRVLAAMESLGMAEVNSPEQAAKLRQTLDVDALVVGTVTAYDPYDPPKLGLAIELYTGRRQPMPSLDVRELTRAPTDETVQPPPADPNQPVSVVSGFYDAADEDVRQRLQKYGEARGVNKNANENWRLYRISMDLYTEFVAYVVSERLLAEERQRLTPPVARSAE